MRGPRCFFGFIILIFLGTLKANASPDLVIFHNGDYAFGKTTAGDASGEILMDIDGKRTKYNKRQVREVFPGLTKPAKGEVLKVSDYIISATGIVPNITAPITTRSRLKTGMEENPEMIFDVESGFRVPKIHLFATNPGFYNRIGSYLVLIVQNMSTETWRAVQFRATFYDENDQLLASKDFYVFRLPGRTPDRIPSTVVKLNIPDISYNIIHRVRIVRKF